MATKEASETTTMAAKPGNEIIRLDIKRGVLQGIVQQPIPAAERGEVHPDHWYTLVQHDLKKHDAVTGNRYTHFHDWAEAIAAWRKLPAATTTAGTAVLLVDTISTRVLRKAGTDDETVQLAITGTIADGFAAPKEEENVSIRDAVTALFTVLGERNDVRWRFHIYSGFGRFCQLQPVTKLDMLGIASQHYALAAPFYLFIYYYIL